MHRRIWEAGARAFADSQGEELPDRGAVRRVRRRSRLRAAALAGRVRRRLASPARSSTTSATSSPTGPGSAGPRPSPSSPSIAAAASPGRCSPASLRRRPRRRRHLGRPRRWTSGTPTTPLTCTTSMGFRIVSETLRLRARAPCEPVAPVADDGPLDDAVRTATIAPRRDRLAPDRSRRLRGRTSAAGRMPARVVAEERGQFLRPRRHVDARRPPCPAGSATTADGDPLAYPAVGDWVAVGEPGRRRHGDDPRPPAPALGDRPPGSVRPRHRRPGPRRQRRHRVHRHLAQRRAEPPAPRALPRRGLGIGRDAGRVLSKADLDDDVAGHRVAVESVAPGVEVIAASAVTGEGVERGPGASRTGPDRRLHRLVGRRQVDPRQRPGRARAPRRRPGSARTTPGAATPRPDASSWPLADGLVIDTPGMRRAGTPRRRWPRQRLRGRRAGGGRLPLQRLPARSEPGCAVRAALASGDLDAGRFEAYRKLEREARRTELANDAVARKAERRTLVGDDRRASSATCSRSTEPSDDRRQHPRRVPAAGHRRPRRCVRSTSLGTSGRSPSCSPRSTSTTASTGCRPPQRCGNDYEHATGQDPARDVAARRGRDGRLVGMVETDWRLRAERVHHRSLAVRPARVPPPRPRPGRCWPGRSSASSRESAKGRWAHRTWPHLFAGWADLEIPEVAPFAAAAGYHVDGYGDPDDPGPRPSRSRTCRCRDGLEVRPVLAEHHRPDLGRRRRGLPGSSRSRGPIRGGLPGGSRPARPRHRRSGRSPGTATRWPARSSTSSSPRRTRSSASAVAGSIMSRSAGRGGSGASPSALMVRSMRRFRDIGPGRGRARRRCREPDRRGPRSTRRSASAGSGRRRATGRPSSASLGPAAPGLASAGAAPGPPSRATAARGRSSSRARGRAGPAAGRRTSPAGPAIRPSAPGEPPGRSTLPQPLAKSVSPLKRRPSSADHRQTDPSVWPGVWRTVRRISPKRISPPSASSTAGTQGGISNGAQSGCGSVSRSASSGWTAIGAPVCSAIAALSPKWSQWPWVVTMSFSVQSRSASWSGDPGQRRDRGVDRDRLARACVGEQVDVGRETARRRG